MLGSAESLSSSINLAQLDIILEAAPKFLEMRLHILARGNMPGGTIEEPELRNDWNDGVPVYKNNKDFHQMF